MNGVIIRDCLSRAVPGLDTNHKYILYALIDNYNCNQFLGDAINVNNNKSAERNTVLFVLKALSFSKYDSAVYNPKCNI